MYASLSGGGFEVFRALKSTVQRHGKELDDEIVKRHKSTLVRVCGTYVTLLLLRLYVKAGEKPNKVTLETSITALLQFTETREITIEEAFHKSMVTQIEASMIYKGVPIKA